MAFAPHGAPYEYEARLPRTRVWAQINKIGGGTLRKKYTGTWEYVLRTDGPDGPVIIQGTDLDIPWPAKHARAAEAAFEFLDHSDLSLYL